MYKVTFNHLGFNPVNYDNLQWWCYETLGDSGDVWSEEYNRGRHIFRFAKESDKMMFMLKWGIGEEDD
jgi:hypothetical protein